MRDLDRAYQNFFAGRAAYPRMRRKSDLASFRESDPACFEVRRISRNVGEVRIPKVGWVRFRGWRDLPGERRSLGISRQGGVWYASIQCRREIDEPASSQFPAVGIDRGVATTLALSDGRLIGGPQAHKVAMGRLARLQRALARKRKFSGNWKKQRAKIARLHTKIANIRLDWLHKQSIAIAKSHGLVVMEDLRVRSMSRSAKGTLETPGTNVSAKSGLNRAILDQGWGTLSLLLDYKLGEHGGQLLLVDPAYSSQTCASCGAVSGDSRRSQSHFACVSCGHSDHADVNAAKVILRRGTPSMPVEGGGCAPAEAGTDLEMVA